MEAKRLKLVQAGYENFTGEIGAYWFEDGVSVELIRRADRDRMSTAFQFEEVNDDGSTQPSGIAHRLVADAAERLGSFEPLQRQTEEEKTAELLAEKLKAKVAPTEIYTAEQLVALADKRGIKGLRTVADKWGVKHRSIPVLIEMILEKQAAFTAKRDGALEAKAQAEAEALVTPVVSETKPAADVDDEDAEVAADEAEAARLAQIEADAAAAAEDDEIQLAAARGDLAAAITAGQGASTEEETE